MIRTLALVLVAACTGPFWQHHDGRSSTDMAALLEQLRVLRASGSPIDVVAYDVPTADDRDTAMAEQVAKKRDPAAVFVGLSGNIHSRRTKGTPWNPELVQPDGTAAVRSPRGRPARAGDAWSLGPARDASHDGVYRIGTATAAAPAVP